MTDITKLREQGRNLLIDQPSSKPAFLERETTPGKFTFLTDHYVQVGTGVGRLIDPAGAVALGLTEKCAVNKWGKVFWISHPDSEETSRRVMNDAYYELPNLLYVTYAWDDDEVNEWFQLSHHERLTMLNARAGGIDYNEVVMPITTRFRSAESDIIEVNAIDKCSVAMFVDGDIYLSWYAKLIEGGKHDPGKKDPAHGTAGQHPMNWVNKNEKAGLRYMKIGDVVDALQKFFDADPNLLFFGQVIDAIIAAHTQWTGSGGSVGLCDSQNATRLAPQVRSQID